MFGFSKKRAAKAKIAEMSFEEIVHELLRGREDPRRVQESLRRLGEAHQRDLAPIFLRAVREKRGDPKDLAALILRFEAIGYKDDEVAPWLPLGDELAPVLLALVGNDKRAASFAAKIAGPGCVTALAAHAHHADSWVRQEVARGLARTGVPEATATLLILLHDASRDVRQSAAWAFAAVRDPRAIPELEKRIDDGDENVGCGALGALLAIDEALGMRWLTTVVSDVQRNPGVRRWAAEKLGRSAARDEVRERLGTAVDLAHVDWYGLPWPASPNADDDQWVRLPRGTWVLHRVADGFVYLRQGALEFKVDEGDFRGRWPDL